jgi:hypothetical protein
VNLFFLNGWQIGKGPCTHCKVEDKGKDVTQRRHQFLHQSSDPSILGKWTAETEDVNLTASFEDITSYVNRASEDTVLIVNEKEKWELERSEISLDFPSTQDQFDIK